MIFFYLVMLSICINAQNAIRIGDKIKIVQLSFIPLSVNTPEDSIVWNMNGSKIVNAKVDKEYFNNCDTTYSANIVSRYGSTLYFFKQDSCSLNNIGFQNHTTRIIYDYPEEMLSYPIVKNKSLHGFFSGKGFYLDTHPMEIYGTFKTDCENEGTLITCDNDTLKNTMLVSTRRIMSTKFFNSNLDSVFDDFKVIEPNEIASLQSVDTSKIIIDDYKCYALGYRYPVLESEVIKNLQDKSLYAASFYIAPTDQLRLIDEENEKIRQQTYLGKKSLIDVRGMVSYNSNDGNHDYSIVQKGSSLIVNYKINAYNNRREMPEVIYGIYSLNGIIYYESHQKFLPSGSYRDIIDLNKLGPEVYIFKISLNGEECTTKFTKK